MSLKGIYGRITKVKIHLFPCKIKDKLCRLEISQRLQKISTQSPIPGETSPAMCIQVTKILRKGFKNIYLNKSVKNKWIVFVAAFDVYGRKTEAWRDIICEIF